MLFEQFIGHAQVIPAPWWLDLKNARDKWSVLTVASNDLYGLRPTLTTRLKLGPRPLVKRGGGTHAHEVGCETKNQTSLPLFMWCRLA